MALALPLRAAGGNRYKTGGGVENYKCRNCLKSKP